MKISMELIEKALDDRSIKIQRKYTGTSMNMMETRVIQTESDFNNLTEKRFSKDNGKTWTGYETDKTYYTSNGKIEILRFVSAIEANSATGHVARSVMERIFPYEHKEVYKKYWTTGVMDWHDHTYIEISRDDGGTYTEKHLLAYENEEGLEFNHGYHGTNIEALADGSFISSVTAPLESVCRAYSLDSDEYALSPVITKAIVVFNIKYNAKTDLYKCVKSQPIIISDEKSSRGLLEPNTLALKDGTMMLECRGSNAVSDGWKTRMKKGTPSYRWVSFSDDGIHFTKPESMTYDDGEGFYSPSSISKWLRHSVNKKLYWVGNIVPDIPDGNRPRSPLCIAEFNEEKHCLIKNSVMVLDKRLPGEGPLVQFSNFSFYEDRETHNMKIEYSRLGQNPDNKYQGDAVRVNIEVE